MAKTALNVTMLSHTPDPEVTIALAGRLCYSDSHILDLREAVEGKAQTFVKKLMDLGHLSPLEHASFTFGAEGVSRSLLAQITRHRIASFSVQSQRYVKQTDADYILPPSIEALGEEEVAEFCSLTCKLCVDRADITLHSLLCGVPSLYASRNANFIYLDIMYEPG